MEEHKRSRVCLRSFRQYHCQYETFQVLYCGCCERDVCDREPHLQLRFLVLTLDLLPAYRFDTNLRVPNGVFQTVFFRFLTLAGDRGKPLQREKACLKTPVFSSILVPSALADPDQPLNTQLRKTPFRKHRL